MRKIRILPHTTYLASILLFCLSISSSHAQENAAPPAETEAETARGDEALAEGSEQSEDASAIKGVSLFERLGQGGITMIFLAALSVCAVTFGLERLINLKKSAINPRGMVSEVKRRWDEGDYPVIQALCQKNPSALSNVVSYLVQHRTCNTLELSTISGDIAGREMRGHLQRAYPLAIIATLAPLLGLFGTVLGMIDSFEVVSIVGSLGDASVLAGGISKALVTTAGGLALAMPTLGAYHYFKSRTNTHSMALERDVNDLLTTWFMEKAAHGQIVPDAKPSAGEPEPMAVKTGS